MTFKEDTTHSPDEMILCLKELKNMPIVLIAGLVVDNQKGDCIILAEYEDASMLNDLIKGGGIPVGVFAICDNHDVLSHCFKNPIMDKDKFREVSQELAYRTITGKA